MIQLEMLKEVKRICEEHDIKYFLDSGTLLGAIRHKGFIPWDDDLDVAFIREEYNKFLNVASKELDNRFFLQTWNNDNEYALPFSKIRMNNTKFVENNSKYIIRINGEELIKSGDYLMNRGLEIKLSGDYASDIIKINKI